MSVPLVDLKAQYSSIRAEIDAAIKRVVEEGNFILGPDVKKFEAEVAEYLGTKFAVGVASGTDALHIALLACGIGKGDEVITTPFTFIATAESIVHCDAKPVFVDIDPKTYNLDPDKIEAKITPRTKAILPVHLYGQAVDMDAVITIAKKHNLKVIEDCAQALGTDYKGKKVGAIGDVGCLSFFPSKNLGAYGDGGMVVTSDPQIAETSNILRKHGAKTTYYYCLHGFNSRLDSLQASILSVKLKYLDKWLNQRREKAGIYNQLLKNIDGIEIPFVDSMGTHSFNYYTIRLKDSRISRDDLRKHLESRGISNAVYYPLSLHLQEIYKYLGYKKSDFPESEKAQEEVLSLPMFAELTEGQIHEVVGGTRDFIKGIKKDKKF